MVYLKGTFWYYCQLNEHVALVMDLREASPKRFAKKIKNLFGSEHHDKFETLWQLLDEYHPRWLLYRFMDDAVIKAATIHHMDILAARIDTQIIICNKIEAL